MMMSSKIRKTKITPTAWGGGVQQLLNAAFARGGLLYLQNLPLKQVGYDLHVYRYLVYLTRLVISILDCWIIHVCM